MAVEFHFEGKFLLIRAELGRENPVLSLLVVSEPMTFVLDIEQTIARLDRIQRLTDDLAKVQGDFIQQRAIAERLRREVAAARRALEPLSSNS